MALTSYKDTGAILTGTYTFRINGRLNYNVTRSNNTLTFTNVYAQCQYYSPNGGASFSYPSGWDLVGQVPNGTQRVSGNWSGSRSAGNTDSTSTAGSFTTTVGATVDEINVRVGARFRNDAYTYANWDISVPALGLPSLTSQSASNVLVTTATITATASAGTNSTGVSSIQLQYGPTTSYGTNITDSSSPFTWDLTDLLPGTTYHYRFVITNAGGRTTTTGDYTFTTLPAPNTSAALLNIVGVL